MERETLNSIIPKVINKSETLIVKNDDDEPFSQVEEFKSNPGG